MKKLLLLLPLVSLLAACSDDAQVASRNLSKAADTLHDVPLNGLFNTVNNRVIGTFGADNENFSTDDSRDGTPWFDAVLDLANTNDPRPQR